MEDPGVFLALIAIVAAVTAAATTSMTMAQKKLVEVLQDSVKAEREEKKLLSDENREQGMMIIKLGASIDKLTEQGSQTIRLLEDVVYGRESASQSRRTT